MATKIHARQIFSRDILSRLYPNITPQELDDLLRSINSELTPPFEIKANNPPNLGVTIGARAIQNLTSNYWHTVPPIGTGIPNLSGTPNINFPSIDGGNIIATPGNTITLNCPANQYAAILVCINNSNNLFIAQGAAASNVDGALNNIPSIPNDHMAIGAIVVFNNNGTIQNITPNDVYQFSTNTIIKGSSSSSSSSNILTFDKIAGVNINAGEPVYLSVGAGGGDTGRTVDRLYVVEPNTAYRDLIWGIANNTVASGGTVQVVYRGTINIPSSLISGGSFSIGENVYWNGSVYSHVYTSGVYVGEATGTNEVLIKSYLDQLMSGIYVHNINDSQITPHNVTGLQFNSANVDCAAIEYAVYRSSNGNNTITTNFNQSVSGDLKSRAVEFLAIAIDSANHIYLGGLFYSYQGVSGRDYLIKVNATTGALDTTFVSAAVDGGKFNGPIYAIAVDSSNNVYVGGNFTDYGGTSGRNYLVKLNGATGAVDTTFVSAAVDGGKFNGPIYAIAIDSTDSVYVGGNFSNYDSVLNRNYLVKLDGATGAVDTTFVSAAVDGGLFNNQVLAIAVDASNDVYVGGDFISYAWVGGRNRLIKLNGATGAVDTTFVSAAVDGSQFNNAIYAIAVDSSNNVYVGGNFTDYGGTSGRNYLVKLNGATGAVDTTFVSAAVDGGKFSSLVRSVLHVGSNDLYVNSKYLPYSNDPACIKFNSGTGLIDYTFTDTAIGYNKNAGGAAICADKTGSLYISTGTNYGGVSGRDYLIKVNATTGALDTTFVSAAVDGGKFNGPIYAIAVDSSNNVYVGGNFTDYGGTSGRNYLVKLNGATGAVDTTFVSAAVDGGKFNGPIYAIAIDSTDSVYVGGNFLNYVLGISYLMKLDGITGDLDDVFMYNVVQTNLFNAPVYAIAIDSFDNVYVGGAFGLGNRNYLIKLNKAGVVDTTFAVAAIDNKIGSPVSCIAIDSSNNVYIGGMNYHMGGDYLVKLNGTTGAVDATFVANAVAGTKFNNLVSSIAIDANDNVYVAGTFLDYLVPGRNYIVKLKPDGTYDAAWDAFVLNKITPNTGLKVATLGASVYFVGDFYYLSSNYVIFGCVGILDFSLKKNEQGRLLVNYDHNNNQWLLQKKDNFGDSKVQFQITPAGQVTYTSASFGNLNHIGKLKLRILSKYKLS